MAQYQRNLASDISLFFFHKTFDSLHIKQRLKEFKKTVNHSFHSEANILGDRVLFGKFKGLHKYFYSQNQYYLK